MTAAHARTFFTSEPNTGPSPHLPFPDEGDNGGGGATGDDGKDEEGDGESDTGKPAEGQVAGEDEWKAKARTWEKRAQNDAREAKKLKIELDQLRKSQMSESEKAIDAARNEGEKAGVAKAARMLVSARLEAALAHLEADARDALIEGVDTSRFITEDSTPDAAAIKKWAERVAPRSTNNGRFPDLGAGRRPIPQPTDMDSLIRRAAGRG